MIAPTPNPLKKKRLFILILLFYNCFVGFLRDLTGSYNMSFTILGSLGVASSIFIAASRLCLRKHREVYHPETGELENQEIIIK